MTTMTTTTTTTTLTTNASDKCAEKQQNVKRFRSDLGHLDMACFAWENYSHVSDLPATSQQCNVNVTKLFLSVRVAVDC